jgi:hypothetical protein
MHGRLPHWAARAKRSWRDHRDAVETVSDLARIDVDPQIWPEA